MTIDLPRLRQAVHGRVLTSDDTGYDEARGLFYGGVDARPAAIVQAGDAQDVIQVVRLARDSGVELAIRSGGHSVAGHSTTEGGLVLDLRNLKALEIDLDEGTAWAETGLTASEFSNAVGAHGMAVGFGDTGSVGLGGITLGGGIGYLARRHGLTIDSLLAAELVTADGELLQLDEAHHPDLFWAIRGGGGNFGVVTRFKLRLHPVAQITGGMLLLPATAETVAGFMAAAEAAPEELSAIANVMNCPPMPFVPEEHHGSLVIMALVCHAGELAAAERDLAPFRSLAAPIADMLQPMPYAQIYPPEDPSYRPTAASRTTFVDALDDSAVRTILEQLAASDASLRAVQLRALGGAVSRVPNEATAYAHRHRRMMVNVASFYDGQEDRPRREAWVREVGAALRQGDDDAGYVNFLEDEGPGRVRAAYPGGAWERLASVKRRYDPTNFFHRNQNIPPAEA